MRKYWSLILALALTLKLNAQFYTSTIGEEMFQIASVTDSGDNSENVLRYSNWINSSVQIHFDPTNFLGFYSGIGNSNIGFIIKQNDVALKFRSYALGMPIAIKIGDLSNHFYVAIGAEEELFYNYKQKIIYENNKDKNSEWFSNKTNLLNSSFFAEVQMPKKLFIRFRYYPGNFFATDQNFDLPDGSVITDFNAQLFYISIGTNNFKPIWENF